MGNITFGSFIAEKRKAHKFNLRDKTPDPVEDTEPETADTAVTESNESDAAKILELLKNPETAALLKQLAKAL